MSRPFGPWRTPGARPRQNAQALDIYKAILKDTSEPGPRLATVQKAIGGLRMDEAEQLIALAKKGELEPIAMDIARARIAAFLHDERKEEVEAADLKLFAEYAKGEKGLKDANQPALLGWYHYKLKNYQDALDWFKLSLEHGGDAMVAHGLAHSLRYLGMKREAEEVAYAWREPLVNNSILFIDILERDLTRPIPPYVEPERLARYGEVTMQTASGEGAQALAWYAYNSCQYDVALQWFTRAVAWHPKEPTVYGLALTLGRLKQDKEATVWINRYDGLFPLVVEIIFPVTVKPPTPCDQRLDQVAALPPRPSRRVWRARALWRRSPRRLRSHRALCLGPRDAARPHRTDGRARRSQAGARIPDRGRGGKSAAFRPGGAGDAARSRRQAPGRLCAGPLADRLPAGRPARARRRRHALRALRLRPAARLQRRPDLFLAKSLRSAGARRNALVEGAARRRHFRQSRRPRAPTLARRSKRARPATAEGVQT